MANENRVLHFNKILRKLLLSISWSTALTTTFYSSNPLSFGTIFWLYRLALALEQNIIISTQKTLLLTFFCRRCLNFKNHLSLFFLTKFSFIPSQLLLVSSIDLSIFFLFYLFFIFQKPKNTNAANCSLNHAQIHKGWIDAFLYKQNRNDKPVAKREKFA